jgi:hypothetical protein
MRRFSKVIAVGALLGGALVLQGCLAMAVTGAAVKTTGAVAKGTVKGGVAVGRAVIPGDSRKDRDED